MGRLLILLVLLMPASVFAAPRTYPELANLALRYINLAIGLSISVGFVIYILGIATNMHSIGKDGMARFKVHVLWGLAAVFVMVSVYGIVSIIRNSLFNGQATTGTGSGVTCESVSDCFFGDDD